MKTQFLIFTISIITFSLFISCENDESMSKSLLTVSGYITYENEPAENVKVSIDDKFNLSTTTDSDGHFIISGISSGDHKLLMVKIITNTNLKLFATNENVSFTKKTVDLTINEDTELENLRLPKAVHLYDANEITSSSATISWSSTSDDKFKEYKLYRYNSSETGTLIHNSNSISDTVYNDKDLNQLQNYYYRVYIMDDCAEIGRTNSISVITQETVIIENGDMENINIEKNFPKYWMKRDNAYMYTLDSLNVHSGKYSIKIHYGDVFFVHSSVYQLINSSAFVVGDRYELSFWLKFDTLISESKFLFILNSDNGNFGFDRHLFGPRSNEEWMKYTHEFTIPDSVNASSYRLGFFGEHLGGQADFLIGWLDDVNIKKIN